MASFPASINAASLQNPCLSLLILGLLLLVAAHYCHHHPCWLILILLVVSIEIPMIGKTILLSTNAILWLPYGHHILLSSIPVISYWYWSWLFGSKNSWFMWINELVISSVHMSITVNIIADVIWLSVNQYCWYYCCQYVNMSIIVIPMVNICYHIMNH